MNEFVAPLENYEKEDIVRRAITQEKDWVNPFPNIHPVQLDAAEKNLREILRDIRRAKIAYRMAQRYEDLG